MKIKLYLIPLSILLVAVITAGIVRVSYTDVISKEYQTYQFSSSLYDSIETIFKKNKIKDEEDLINQSDLIIKGKFTGERKITTHAFYSTVTAEDVYKGDKSFKGHNIIYTESIEVFNNTKFLNSLSFMCLPLQKGREYILLLKKYPFNKARKLDDIQKKQYYLITNSALGYFPLNNAKQTERKLQ
ncbi:MAG: hypothetical protein LKE53_05635 [Oscillospiraceae bacterium]|jgi:nitrogen fixation-related uncharacterized protein|nr:hypothetical protein [Oscillospiraceae bacterium]